jgi:taurine dioxygenase
MPIEVTNLQDDLSFGARIRGVSRETLADEGVRQQIREVFEARGMIVFEGVEPTSAMQVMISEVIGPLKEHPVKMVERLDGDKLPGVITIRTAPDAAIVEIDGKPLMTWQPWHFDHSYNDELNRAGVLRAEAIATDGGLTAFADGIQLYKDLPEATRRRIEGLEVLYTLDLRYSHQPFGLPESFRLIQDKGDKLAEMAATLPRAIHPAVWTRKTGEKVAHFSPYGCAGVVGMEKAEAIALLADAWKDVDKTLKPYVHQWRPTDMLAWDNWRMLHMACGCNPQQERIMHRTTIKGDYGLGRWETPPKPAAAPADAMM